MKSAEQLPIMRTKEELLGTQMHNLFPGDWTFNRYFVLHRKMKKCRIIYAGEEADIPTLRQFFENNPGPPSRTREFVCHLKRFGFSRQTVSYRKLETLLLSSGFTSEDWPHLESIKQLRLGFRMQSMVPDGKRKSLPFILACNLRGNSEVFRTFSSLFWTTENGTRVFQDPKSITVEQVLAITQEHIEGLMGKAGMWRFDYQDVQGLRLMLKGAKQKLVLQGFTEFDGPFMSISFEKEKKAPWKRESKRQHPQKYFKDAKGRYRKIQSPEEGEARTA